MRQPAFVFTFFRVVAGLLLAFYFVLALAILGLRYVILPNLDDYRPRLEALATQALGAPVQIGSLEGSWYRLHPELVLTHTRILGPDGEVALTLPRVQARMSWRSLLTLRPQFLRLRIDQPHLRLQRDDTGMIRVAGFPLLRLAHEGSSLRRTREDREPASPASSLQNEKIEPAPPASSLPSAASAAPVSSVLATKKPNWWRSLEDMHLPPAAWDAADHPFATWLLAQPDIWIRNAAVSWEDESGHLPSLELDEVDLRLQARRLGVSRFVLDVPGSFAGARHLRLQAEWQRHWLGALEGRETGDWQGKVFMAVDQLDLGWLAPWLKDQAGESLAGLLAARLWLDFRGGAWEFRNADVAVRNLRWLQGSGQPALALSDAGATLQRTESGAALQARMGPALLDLPGVFADSVLVVHQLSGQLQRRVSTEGQESWLFDQVKADAGEPGRRAQVEMSGLWRATPSDPRGYLDLKGRILEGEAGAVARWMPKGVDAGLRHWLQEGLRAGRVDQAEVLLRGPLGDFPFVGENSAKGDFRIAGQVRDVAIDIQPDIEPGWPLLSGLQGELVIERDHLWANIAGGAIRLGEDKILQIGATRLDIPDMGSDARVEVQGEVNGPAAAMQAYLQSSPLADQTAVLQEAEIEGNLELPLQLSVGLGHNFYVKVQGEVRAQGNRIVLPGWPMMSEVQGSVAFSESGAQLKQVQARWLGGALGLEGSVSQEGAAQLRFEGQATATALREYLSNQDLSWLGGTLPYAGRCERSADGAGRCDLSSPLRGTRLNLPKPFDKAESENWPLEVQWNRSAQGQTQLHLEADQRLSAVAQWGADGGGGLPQRLGVAVPGAAVLPAQGWQVEIRNPELDLDAWQEAFRPAADSLASTGPGSRAPTSSAGLQGRSVAGREPASQARPRNGPTREGNGHVSSGSGTALPWQGWALPLQVDVQTKQLRAMGHDWGPVTAGLEITSGDILRLVLQSASAQGRVGWRPESVAGPAKLEVDLEVLRLPRRSSEETRDTAAYRAMAVQPAATGATAPEGNSLWADPARWPYVSLNVDKLYWGDFDLGEVSLTASPRADAQAWLVDDFQLSLPDATVQGRGQWEALGASPRSQWWVEGQIEQLGRLLAHFGLQDVLAGGRGTLQGKLAWPGAPWDFSLTGLEGELQLELQDGRFLPVSSTAARLLGILSLQSLARSIAFQGQSVFEAGFVWDTLRSAGRLQHGQLDLQGFEMRGPSAAAVLQGHIDLVAETQDLQVLILPRIDASAAAVLAGLAINPIVGAGAFLTQWLLREPLAHVLSLDYAVTGSWDDPKVTRLRGSRAAAAEETAAEPVAP